MVIAHTLESNRRQCVSSFQSDEILREPSSSPLLVANITSAENEYDRGRIVRDQRDWTVEQRAEIVAAMDRILADHRFNASKRCVLLLQRLVEHALQGNHERLKERTLGIEVFGREPNYDTSSDPIVRSTATEIRKRLAQYYEDSEHHCAVRIHLIAGSYLPQFDFGKQETPTEDCRTENPLVSMSVLESDASHKESDPAPVRLDIRRRWFLGGAAAFLVAIVAVLAVRPDRLRSTDYLVWKPFLDSNGLIIVCVSDRDPLFDQGAMVGESRRKEADAKTPDGTTSDVSSTYILPRVLYQDAFVAYTIGYRLSQFGKRSYMRSSSMLTAGDFRHNPIVLIGGLNNPWSMMVLSNLRYSLRSDPVSGERWIQDAKDPSKREWKVEGSLRQESADYAIVSRCFDAQLGGWVMVFSGLGPLGTEAAAAFVTAPSSVPSLPASLRTARNFQVVLKVAIVGGNSGSPQVLTSQTW